MDDLICDERDFEILKASVLGINERTICRRYQISARQLHDALERSMIQLNQQQRQRAVRRQLERIEVMIKPFLTAALAGETAAASVMIKLMEREASLLALDQPMRIDATLIEPPQHVSSTQEFEEAIARLVGKPAQSH